MRAIIMAVSAAVLLTATAAQATTVSDDTGDFLKSFSGAKFDDFDITSFTVTFDQANAAFDFSATVNGAIDPTHAGIFVIGVDTGTGVARPFGDIHEGNVIFNQAILFRESTCDASFTTCTAALGAGRFGVAISGGNTFGFSVPTDLLTSTGFAPRDYRFNLWSRIALVQNSDNADFAPDNAVFSAVPEPAAWALMLGGLGLTGAAMRRRRAASSARHA